MGGSTEVRLAIMDDQVMSDHGEMSSGKCTLGMEGSSHWIGTVNPPLRNTSTLNTPPIREMEDQVVAALVISKATLQRLNLRLSQARKLSRWRLIRVISQLMGRTYR